MVVVVADPERRVDRHRRIVEQLADGRLVYLTRDRVNGTYAPERRILQDEILHLRGFSLDGKSGIPLTKSARQAMGLGPGVTGLLAGQGLHRPA